MTRPGSTPWASGARCATITGADRYAARKGSRRPDFLGGVPRLRRRRGFSLPAAAGGRRRISSSTRSSRNSPSRPTMLCFAGDHIAVPPDAYDSRGGFAGSQEWEFRKQRLAGSPQRDRDRVAPAHAHPRRVGRGHRGRPDRLGRPLAGPRAADGGHDRGDPAQPARAPAGRAGAGEGFAAARVARGGCSSSAGNRAG